ncbi:MAG: pirin family protein [Proteobacteria bacterium]|nr:pirin family protein [Pseudomonadota bacterium]HQR04167.1 pirin family protein [Rhodocyclaceae bacterium]
MIQLRKAGDRGHFDHGWLKTWHSFSFADYHDPEQMNWGPLRVINEDIIAPGEGFGTHGHRDMEIITYMLSGTLRHGDSMENSELLARPEIQRMSAGRGVRHSEVNASAHEAAHLLQVWIQPDVRGIAPEYEQKIFADGDKQDRLLLLVSPDGREGSLPIHQDALLHATILTPGHTITYALAAGRRAYVQVARGALTVNGQPLMQGDGARIADEPRLTLRVSAEADGPAEVLLFDLP